MIMFKQVKTGILAVLMIGFLASCQSNDVRDAARQDVDTNANVTPAPTTPTTAPAPATPAAPAGPTTTMTFEATEFDFGIVQDGEKVAHTYSFTNTGNEPLILSDAKGSCGCTVPKWPREPIAPGATSEITVEFNSKNKKGKRNQKVTITANTSPPQTFIYLKGEVQGGEAAAQPQIQVNQ